MTSMACGGPVPPDAASNDAPAELPLTAREKLTATDADLRVIPFDTRGELKARRTLIDSQYSDVPLHGEGGRLAIRSDGDDLVVDSALIRLEPVTFDESQLPPHGLTLKDLRLELQSPVRGELRWFGGGSEGDVELEGDFVLKGTLVTESGAEAPFLPQRFDSVPVHAAVSTDAMGNLVARFSCERDGVTWSWAGLTETGKLVFDGRAVEDPLETR